jgi:hypothetical protein
MQVLVVARLGACELVTKVAERGEDVADAHALAAPARSFLSSAFAHGLCHSRPSY